MANDEKVQGSLMLVPTAELLWTKVFRSISAIIFYLLTASMVIVSALSFLNALSWIDKPFAGFLIYEFPNVGSMGIKDWPGNKARLRYMDRVIAVENQPIRRGQDLIRQLSQVKRGTPIQYRIQSEGTIRSVTVPAAMFSVRDFLLVFLIPYCGGLALFILGVIVYVIKPHTAVSWVFLILCFTLGSYMVTGFEMQSTYYFERFHFIICPLFPATFLHLGLIFPDRKQISIRFPRLTYLIYLPVLIMVIAYQIYLSYFPKVLNPNELPWVLRYENIATLDLSYTLICVGGLILLIFRSMRKAATSLARQRAKIILFGVTAFFPSIIVELADFFMQIDFPLNFLTFFVIFFPLSIAYAVVKHNLFDADRMIRVTVGYTLVTAIIAGIYFLVSISLNLFFGKYLIVQSKVFPLVFTISIILIFNPLRNRIQTLIDRLFFRREYDYGEVIEKFGGGIASSVNQKQILSRLMRIFTEELFIDTISIMLLNPSRAVYEISSIYGRTNKGTDSVTLSREEPLVRIIEKEKRELADYQILEDPKYGRISQDCRKIFQTFQANLIIPFVFQGEVTGLIALGEKKSGKPYNLDDIHLLNTLAKQAAVSLEHAKLADHVKNEEKVRTNLARYLSPQVVDQIIKEDAQVTLGGDRKIVTVLISDIRNFTHITEKLTPDQLIQLLNEYFTEMTKIIFERRGSLDKYVGDAIVAIFGSLIPLENHARAAAETATRMMDRIELLNKTWVNQYGHIINIGIGINTGEVFLGNVGSADRMEFAVIGDTVNVASRLSALARPGQILATIETLTMIGADLKSNELPEVEIKGKEKKVRAFELLY